MYPASGLPVIRGETRATSVVTLTTDAAGTSLSVVVLSAGLNSGSRRLVTVAVASSSPPCVTVPQMVTFVLVSGVIQATSHVRWGAVPVQPEPRSE